MELFKKKTWTFSFVGDALCIPYLPRLCVHTVSSHSRSVVYTVWLNCLSCLQPVWSCDSPVCSVVAISPCSQISEINKVKLKLFILQLVWVELNTRGRKRCLIPLVSAWICWYFLFPVLLGCNYVDKGLFFIFLCSLGCALSQHIAFHNCVTLLQASSGSFTPAARCILTIGHWMYITFKSGIFLFRPLFVLRGPHCIMLQSKLNSYSIHGIRLSLTHLWPHWFTGPPRCLSHQVHLITQFALLHASFRPGCHANSYNFKPNADKESQAVSGTVIAYTLYTTYTATNRRLCHIYNQLCSVMKLWIATQHLLFLVKDVAAFCLVPLKLL